MNQLKYILFIIFLLALSSKLSALTEYDYIFKCVIHETNQETIYVSITKSFIERDTNGQRVNYEIINITDKKIYAIGSVIDFDEWTVHKVHPNNDPVSVLLEIDLLRNVALYTLRTKSDEVIPRGQSIEYAILNGTVSQNNIKQKILPVKLIAKPPLFIFFGAVLDKLRFWSIS